MAIKIKENNLIDDKYNSGTLYSKDWDSFKIKFLDSTDTAALNPIGITKISYGVESEEKLNYGRGNSPVSKANGNVTYSGNVTMTASAIEDLMDVAFGEDVNVNRIPQNIGAFDVDIIVTNKNSTTENPKKGHKITLFGCTINSYMVDVSQGDSETYVNVNFNPLKIVVKKA